MKPGYRIYFDESPLFIVDVKDQLIIDNAVTIHHRETKDLQRAITMMDQEQCPCVIITTKNLDESLDAFKKQFLFIQAGGGLVRNEKDEYLFIFRRGKWDLPKGKLDEGETIDACAVREVQEETGLKDVELLDHLTDTWHAYHERGNFILKESVWFSMQTHSSQALTPQTEEGIHDIKWLKKNDWKSIYNNTFPSIKDVLEKAS